jgi:hypothetical protein
VEEAGDDQTALHGKMNGRQREDDHEEAEKELSFQVEMVGNLSGFDPWSARRLPRRGAGSTG